MKQTPELPQIPVDLADVAKEYLESRRADARRLCEAARAGDYVLARRLGHNMKGSGSGYGFAQVSQLGARIERAAERGNGEEIERAARELSEYVERVCAALF